MAGIIEMNKSSEVQLQVHRRIWFLPKERLVQVRRQTHNIVTLGGHYTALDSCPRISKNFVKNIMAYHFAKRCLTEQTAKSSA